MLNDFLHGRLPQWHYTEQLPIRRPIRYSMKSIRSAIRGITRSRIPIRGFTRIRVPVRGLTRLGVPIHPSYVAYTPVAATNVAKFS
jgi:hypothetical protein